MTQWEIWTWDFPGGRGPHPAVIVSSAARVANVDEVNVLICTSQRAARLAKLNEVLLDSADGLNWETLCRCDLIFFAPKSELHQRRGVVTEERRRHIVRRILNSMTWDAL